MAKKGCKACQADTGRKNDARDARRKAALEKMNARRQAIGWKEYHPWQWQRWYWRDSVSQDDAEVCARVFGGKAMWWEKEPGYIRDEVKAALRRSPAMAKAKRDKWGHYKPLDYSLPLPSLAASSKRLAKAVIHAEDETWTGPKAAEEYIAYRRAQLGLDLPEVGVAA